MSRLRFANVRWSRILFSFAAVAALGACDTGGGTAASDDTVFGQFDIRHVNGAGTPIDGANPRVGEPSSIFFDVLDAQGQRVLDVNTHWVSSNPAVAQVTTADVITKSNPACTQLNPCSSGKGQGSRVNINPLAKGEATLTGTVVGHKKPNGDPVTVSVLITVGAPAARVTWVPTTLALTVGQTATVTPQVFDADGHRIAAGIYATCVERQDVAKFVGVSATGVPFEDCGEFGGDGDVMTIRGFAPGVTRIKGEYLVVPGETVNAESGFLTVAVVNPTATLSTNPTAVSVVAGGTTKVTASITDNGTTSVLPTATWTSNNTAIADVDATGLVTAKSAASTPGQTRTVTVTASLSPLTSTASTVVTVYRAPARAVVTPNLTLSRGGTGSVSASLLDTDNITEIPTSATKLMWSVDDPTIATVPANASGSSVVVTALQKVGSTQVRVHTAEGVQGVATVTVSATQSTITIYKLVNGTFVPANATENVAVNNVLTLGARTVDAGGAEINPPITWISGNTNIATVNGNGDVTGKLAGSTTITASSTTPNITPATITVNVAGVAGGPPVSMTLSPTTAAKFSGETQRFTVTLKDANGNTTTIEAGSSVGYAIDDSPTASLTVDPFNPLAIDVLAKAAGTTTVRAFYIRNGAQTNIFASSPFKSCAVGTTCTPP